MMETPTQCRAIVAAHPGCNKFGVATNGGKSLAKSYYGFKGKPGFKYIFLTPTQLAQAFQVSLKTIERLRSSGTGPPFIKFLNKTIRYPVTTLDQWVADLEQTFQNDDEQK